VAQSQEVVIVGYLPISTGAKEIGSLLIATAEKRGFRFAGKVGTGFTEPVRRDLWRKLEKDRINQPPVVDPPREKAVVWAKPRLVAQVSFGEWTRDGRMRHPVFQGLREDKKPEETLRERPEQAKQESRSSPRGRGDAGAPTVQLTHPDKLLFPQSGITKRDVFEYDRELAPFLLPALKERPLAFEQWPQGIAKAGIFRQTAPV